MWFFFSMKFQLSLDLKPKLSFLLYSLTKHFIFTWNWKIDTTDNNFYNQNSHLDRYKIIIKSTYKMNSQYQNSFQQIYYFTYYSK